MAKIKTVSVHGWWVVVMVVILASTWMPRTFDRILAHKHRAETYLTVSRVAVGNSIVDEPVLMDVDRTIHRQFSGSWSVEVRTFPERSVFCTGFGDVIYRPDAELPKPVTLEWWAFSKQCNGKSLKVDEYIIVTSWTIKSPRRGVPDQTVTIESNPFTVRPADPADAFNQLQQLERKIDQLGAAE